MLYSIVPYIVGATISPVLLAMAIVLLAQKDQPITKAMTYLLGAWTAAFGIGSFIFLTVRQRAVSGRPTLTDSLIHIVVGVLVLGLAMRMWRQKKKHQKKVASKVRFSKMYFLGIALMAFNFSSLIMFVPASLELQGAGVLIRFIGLCLMVAAASLAIWLPIIVVVVSGQRGRKVLDRLNVFMVKHGQQLSASVLAIIALYIIYRGVVGIW